MIIYNLQSIILSDCRILVADYTDKNGHQSIIKIGEHEHVALFNKLYNQ